MTNPLVLNNIPLTGSYRRGRNSQFQTTLPSEMRDTYLARQEKEKIKECWIYMSRKDNKLILKDNPEKDECPDYFPINISSDGRFVARFEDELLLNTPDRGLDMIFRGCFDYVEVTRSR